MKLGPVTILHHPMEMFLSLMTQMVRWVCTVIAGPVMDPLGLDCKKLNGDRKEKTDTPRQSPLKLLLIIFPFQGPPEIRSQTTVPRLCPLEHLSLLGLSTQLALVVV